MKKTVLLLVGIALFVVSEADADKSYFNASWKTLKFKTEMSNRRNSPTSYSSRCACKTPGTLVLNKKEISNILIMDGKKTVVIGPAGAKNRKTVSSGAMVDMKYYTSVVILNGDDYTIYGENREISRSDPWGLWIVR